MPSRHVIWKRRFGRLLGSRPRPRPRCVVLNYHAVGSGPASLALDRFEEQVDWLAGNANVVGVEDILGNQDGKDLRVGLTFDDGYASVARAAAPVLRRAGMTATIFLSTGCVGETAPQSSDTRKGHLPGEDFLVWGEVEALHRYGWTFGSHGVDHVDLSKLSDADISHQLRASKAEIEKRLMSACDQFAYTWGNHDGRVRDAVARTGYVAAYACVHGEVLPASDQYAIPRIDIRCDYELDDFVAAVCGDWDYLGWIQRARRMLR